MKDKEIYTSETLAAIIRHLRSMMEFFGSEEARLILLHSAAREYGTPVDSQGRPQSAIKYRKRELPEIEPELRLALERGTFVRLPAHQEEVEA